MNPYNYSPEQEPQQETYGMPQAPPVIMPSERADLLDKIQPGKVVTEVYHRLLGESNFDGTWMPDPDLASRSLTKRGAWDIATLMIPVSSQNVSLSKLKDHEIRARALSIAKTAQIMCLRNWRSYGIKGVDQLYFVHELVFSNTFITLKQPESEGIRVLLKNIASADFAPPPEQDQGGILNMFRSKR